MAYTKKNYYQRIIDVQELTLRLQQEQPDISLKEIYNTYIYPRWRIGRRTFSSYLAVNAKKLIKEMEPLDEQSNPNQLNLFE